MHLCSGGDFGHCVLRAVAEGHPISELLACKDVKRDGLATETGLGRTSVKC